MHPSFLGKLGRFSARIPKRTDSTDSKTLIEIWIYHFDFCVWFQHCQEVVFIYNFLAASENILIRQSCIYLSSGLSMRILSS